MALDQSVRSDPAPAFGATLPMTALPRFPGLELLANELRRELLASCELLRDQVGSPSAESLLRSLSCQPGCERLPASALRPAD